MRISSSTVIHRKSGARYLINFPSGSIDRLKEGLADKIKLLNGRDSFEPELIPVSGKICEQLEDRGYLTSLSPREETRENERRIEKRRTKAICGPKHRAIVLDPEIGKAFCGINGKNEKLSGLDKALEPNKNPISSLEEALERISTDEAKEVDIWLDPSRGKANWEDIYSLLRGRDLTPSRVWTAVDSDRKQLKDWARRKLFPLDVALAVKEGNQGWGEYSMMEPGGEFEQRNLLVRRLKSSFEVETAYFICPFIYNSVFFSESSVSYCPAGRTESDRDIATRHRALKRFLSGESNSGLKMDASSLIKRAACEKITGQLGDSGRFRRKFFEELLNKTIEALSPSVIAK